MSIQEKVSGRLKKAAGDLAGDEGLRDQGVREERKGELKRELREAEQRAARLRDEIARLEYATDSELRSEPAARDQPFPPARADDTQTGSRRSDGETVDTARRERR